MTTSRIIRLVTRREVRERGKSKAYLLGSAFTILLLVAVIALPARLGGGATEYRVGLVGADGADLVAAARELAALEAGEDEEPATFQVVEYAERASAETALSDGEVEAVIVGDGLLLVRSAAGGFFDGGTLQQVLQRAAATLQVQELVAEQGGAAQEVIARLTEEPLTVEPLDGADREEAMGRGVVAYGGLILMYMAVLTYGQWTLSGVTEEKTNRVVELLLAAVRPWHLLAGKVLGIGLLGLAQFVLALVAVLVTVRVAGVAELPEIPASMLVTLVVWFVLGFGLYSVIYAAAGSLVSRMEEAQNASFPVTIVAVVGFFVSFRVLDNPGDALAVVMSFVPFTAPFVVPIRLALDALPVWQHALAAALTLGAIYWLLRFAGRVYAGGLLQFGGRVKLRDAYRAAEG
jgi:ABC-2 type transport system permease protein